MASSGRPLTSGAAARPTTEAPGLSGTAGKGWAEGPGLFGGVGGDGAPEPRAAPTHVPTICTHSTHKHAHSRTHKCSQMHTHACTQAHMYTLARAHMCTHWDVSFPHHGDSGASRGIGAMCPRGRRTLCQLGPLTAPKPQSPRGTRRTASPRSPGGLPTSCVQSGETSPHRWLPPPCPEHRPPHARLAPVTSGRPISVQDPTAKAARTGRLTPVRHTAVVLVFTLPAGLWQGPRAWHTVSPTRVDARTTARPDMVGWGLVDKAQGDPSMLPGI